MFDVDASGSQHTIGRMPWTYNLGANVTWTLPVEGIDLKARLSVYNLLNDQEVINVRGRYEKQPGVYRTTFGTGTRWQSPPLRPARGDVELLIAQRMRSKLCLSRGLPFAAGLSFALVRVRRVRAPYYSRSPAFAEEPS